MRGVNRFLSGVMTAGLFLALPVMASAHAQSGAIAAAVAMEGRDAADRALDEGRMPAKMLAFMGVETGDSVLDIFAGGGYYTEMLAYAVGPTGEVIAVNPPQFMARESAMKKWRGVVTRAPNSLMIPQQLDAMNVGENRFDAAMLHLIYHDFYWESEQFKFKRLEPASVLASLFKAMKPGGTVTVIDHVANPGGDTREVVEKLHRIDPATVRSDFEAAGFVFDGQSDALHIAADDHSGNVFDEAIRGKTDRFAFRFKKPE